MKRTSVPIFVLAVVVAACGGGANAGVASLDDTATTSTTTAERAAVSTEEALLAFTECLREHGLEVDDPDFDGTGGFGLIVPGGGGVGGGSGAGPDDDTQAAMEACQPLLEGIRGQFNDFDPSQLEDQLYAFAECMRDEGVDWPDPDLTAFAPGGGGAGPPGAQGGEPGEGPNQGGGPFAGNGVDMEDPLVQAALETCQSDVGFGLPGGGPGGGPGGTPPGGQG